MRDKRSTTTRGGELPREIQKMLERYRKEKPRTEEEQRSLVRGAIQVWRKSHERETQVR